MDVSESDESRKVGEMEIHHFSHPQHPLLFISDQSFATEEDQVSHKCFGCRKSLENDSRYGCNECKYYLHKQCAELSPQIDHPFHPQHLLSLLPNSPSTYVWCDFCRRISFGFVYHCDICDFDLHIDCALLQSSIAPKFPNSLHQHPLFFVQNHDDQVKKDCSGCKKPLSGPIYHCFVCSSYPYFNLHKECAELPLEINHPFHSQHLLTLLPEPPYVGGKAWCNFCNETLLGFVYHCSSCDEFDLDINCALLQSSIAPNFPNSLHKHSLFLVPNYNDQLKQDCSGCMKPLSGPIYHCSVCSSSRIFFNFHKECGELPLEINHPYDRKHPLTLLQNPPSHPQNCSCYLCEIKWKGFVYSCPCCNFHLTPKDVSAPRTITNASHQHPWTLLSRQMPFTCDFCGTSGDRTPYLCSTCDLLVHRNCISLPLKIMITRHHHVISHSYSLRQNQLEERICRICYQEVDTRYGSYHCSKSDCNYIVHPLCATDKYIWDGTIIPDDYDEGEMEALLQPSNMINVVFEQMGEGEQMVAIEIKHDFHHHNLRLMSSAEIKYDGIQCDGCMRPMSTPFYSCDQCKFDLHKDCADLPKRKRHPFHKHLLTLSNSMDDYGVCSACQREFDGFSYRCNNKGCVPGFNCDIRCILLSDTLEHPSHEHSLFLVHNSPANCSGCLGEIDPRKMAYRCMKRCDFILDIKCATIPLKVQYKYDRHPLTLTYSDDSSPSQHYCDLCENKRDPKDWFYHCTDCDNSLHSICALGYPQFLKLGRKFRTLHRHPLSVVKNIWNCPPCIICRNLCNGPAVECKESECNFTVHWICRFILEILGL